MFVRLNFICAHLCVCVCVSVCLNPVLEVHNSRQSQNDSLSVVLTRYKDTFDKKVIKCIRVSMYDHV